MDTFLSAFALLAVVGVLAWMVMVAFAQSISLIDRLPPQARALIGITLALSMLAALLAAFA